MKTEPIIPSDCQYQTEEQQLIQKLKNQNQELQMEIIESDSEKDGLKSQVKSLLKKIKEIQSTEQQKTETLGVQLLTKDKQILDLKKDQEQQRIERIKKTEELKAKDDHILEFKKDLEAKKQQLFKKTEEVQKKDHQILDLKLTLELSEQQCFELTKKTEELRTKDEQIFRLKSTLKASEQQMIEETRKQQLKWQEKEALIIELRKHKEVKEEECLNRQTKIEKLQTELEMRDNNISELKQKQEADKLYRKTKIEKLQSELQMRDNFISELKQKQEANKQESFNRKTKIESLQSELQDKIDQNAVLNQQIEESKLSTSENNELAKEQQEKIVKLLLQLQMRDTEISDLKQIKKTEQQYSEFNQPKGDAKMSTQERIELVKEYQEKIDKLQLKLQMRESEISKLKHSKETEQQYNTEFNQPKGDAKMSTQERIELVKEYQEKIDKLQLKLKMRESEISKLNQQHQEDKQNKQKMKTEIVSLRVKQGDNQNETANVNVSSTSIPMEEDVIHNGNANEDVSSISIPMEEVNRRQAELEEGVKKRPQSTKYPLIGGINPKKHLILSDQDFKAIFPQAQTSNKPNSVGSKDTVFLLLVKLTCSLDICHKYFLAPPPGVSKRQWVCVFGHTCKVLTISSGGADIKAAIDYAKRIGLTVNYQEEERYEQFFVDHLARPLGQKGSCESYLKKNKGPMNIKPITFVTLFPLNREKDKEVLKSVFGDLPYLDRPNTYFACPHHFEVYTRTGAVGLSRKIVLNFDPSRRGNLNPEAAAFHGANFIKENLLPIITGPVQPRLG